MRITRRAALPLLASAGLLLSACASSSPSSVPTQLLAPEFVVRQSSGVGVAARNMTGNLPIRFEIEVRNPSGEPIQLDRIQVETMGLGAYSISPQSKPFTLTIGSNRAALVEMWAPAVASDTILGLNGPVTLRLTANFSSEFGKFQRVVVTQVNDQSGRARVVR